MMFSNFNICSPRSKKGTISDQMLDLAFILNNELEDSEMRDIIDKVRHERHHKTYTVSDGPGKPVAGGCILRELNANVALVSHLAISRMSQGKGHGRLILEQLSRHYRQILVLADNSQVQFFVKMGFRTGTDEETHKIKRKTLQQSDWSKTLMVGSCLEWAIQDQVNLI